ncbi:MAG: hypothetical protein HY898_02950 [Deltaproteobacteria bacterium]|nr:hypothetical protein [Deltaproteobacteria bacterium]
MAFRRPLEVRPLRHYAPPSYPAADDLQAALRERPLGPWPFLAPSSLVSALVAATAASACAGASPPPVVTTEPAPPPPPPPPAPVSTMAVEADAALPVLPEPTAVAPPPEPPQPAPLPAIGLQLPHAFSWEASHLPIHWTPYGTGAPARLSEQQVRPVVERVLMSAGIRANSKVQFSRPGIEVELDGYDAVKKVGWIFVEWQKLEDPAGFRGNMGKVNGKDGNDFSKMISHAEMRALMELEKQKKEHIIVISYQDGRFATSYDSKQPHPATPLAKLENNLRAYIGWLKSQGAL